MGAKVWVSITPDLCSKNLCSKIQKKILIISIKVQSMSTAQNQNKKFRSWCFTSFNVTREEFDRILSLPSTYIVVGKEVCPETGKHHFQGYVEYASPRSMSAVKKSLGPQFHLEVRKGTAAQAADYCKKDGEFEERGTRSQPQGARNDIASVRDHIEEGKSFEELVDVATSYQSLKIAQTILPYKEPKRDWIPVVRWYYGVSGAGKTHTSYHNHPNDRVYKKSGTDKWWPGYDGHPVVIIDDFRPEFCSFVRLLDLLDRYPCTVEYKGGSRQFVPKFIYITAPDHPEAYFRDQLDSYSQLDRRITEVRYFSKKYIAPVNSHARSQTQALDPEEDNPSQADGFQRRQEVCKTGDESSEA